MVGGIGVFAVLIVSLGYANIPPTMEDQYVTTVEDTPVDIVIRARDEDIDPLDATAHLMRFVILEGPSHGVLIGDLTDVRYEGPYDVVVEVTYVPAEGFVGTDVVTIAAFDPFDETARGTVTIRIAVAATRVEGILSGRWGAEISYDLDAMGISSWTSRLTGVYRIGQWVVRGTIGMEGENLGEVKTTTVGPVQLEGAFAGDAVHLRSVVGFNSEKTGKDTFDFLRTTAQFALSEVGVSHQLYLDDVQTRSYQTLTVRSTVDGVRIAGTMRTGKKAGGGFTFSQFTMSAAFTACQIYANGSFTGEGFHSASIGMNDYPIPGFVDPSFGVYVDAVLRFTPEEKTLNPSLQLRTRWVDCVRILGRLMLDGTTGMDGFSLYGLAIREEIGGVTFRSATALDPAKNASVTGQVDYFGLITLSGTTMTCEGATGTWSIATYFQNDHPALLGWGMTKTRVNVAISEELSISLSVTARTGGFGDPRMEIAFGWTFRW